MDDTIGQIHQVYFEDLKPNGEIMGFSDNGMQVFVDGSEELLGLIKTVKIISNSRTSLKGVVLP
jgi:tRNA-2-methylthio-N6-dimethylallyladenosine synthase